MVNELMMDKDEYKLWVDYRENGSKVAQNKLAEKYIKLVLMYANRFIFKNKNNNDLSEDDIVSNAYYGFSMALEKFDYTIEFKEVLDKPFIPYLKKYIEGHLISNATFNDEYAYKVKVNNIHRKKAKKELIEAPKLIKTDGIINENGETCDDFFYIDSEIDPSLQYDKLEDVELLNKFISKLDEMCQIIVREYEINGSSLMDISNKIGYSKEWVRQKLDESMEKLKLYATEYKLKGEDMEKQKEINLLTRSVSDKKEIKNIENKYDALFPSEIINVPIDDIIDTGLSLKWFSSGDITNIISDKLEHMEESIKKYFIKTPIKLTKDFKLIGGRRRIHVCKKLGYDYVPCQIATRDISLDEFELHIIEDNYLQRNIGSKEYRKLREDLLILIKKKYPNWDKWIKDSRVPLIKKLKDMGLNGTVARKVAQDERRLFQTKNPTIKDGTVFKDYQMMVVNIENLKNVFSKTNNKTQEKVYPKIKEMMDFIDGNFNT